MRFSAQGHENCELSYLSPSIRGLVRRDVLIVKE